MNRDMEIADAQAAVTRFRNRVLPLLFAGYVLNFLDRTNISYAQLQMGADLGISLANEWASDGIRVIAVSPGYVKTPLIQRSIDAGELNEEKLAAMHPMNRLATVDEIAGAIIALSGPPFLFMTGSVVEIDGGMAVGK